jgi:hypothetical protein
LSHDKKNIKKNPIKQETRLWIKANGHQNIRITQEHGEITKALEQLLAAHQKQCDPTPQCPRQMEKVTWAEDWPTWPRPVTTNTNPKGIQINNGRIDWALA